MQCVFKHNRNRPRKFILYFLVVSYESEYFKKRDKKHFNPYFLFQHINLINVCFKRKF